MLGGAIDGNVAILHALRAAGEKTYAITSTADGPSLQLLFFALHDGERAQAATGGGDPSGLRPGAATADGRLVVKLGQILSNQASKNRRRVPA